MMLEMMMLKLMPCMMMLEIIPEMMLEMIPEMMSEMMLMLEKILDDRYVYDDDVSWMMVM